LAADVVLGAVGVKRDLGAIENSQQRGFVCVKPGQQSIEHGKAGAPFEDTVEARLQLGLAAA